MMEDAIPLIEHIRNHENIYLATKCLASANPSDKQIDLANELLVDCLDRFKYEKPFKYRWLFALKEIRNIWDKTKHKRLTQNADFWFTKYAYRENEPNDLNTKETKSFKELISIVRTSELEDLLIDAMHTIVHHILKYNEGEKNIFLTELDSKVRKGKISDRLKKQILIAYGELKYKSAIDYLIGIVRGGDEEPIHKALALNSLGAIDDKIAVPVLMTYLETKGAKYRDSAAWALSEILPQDIEKRLLDILDNFLKEKEMDCQYTIGTTLLTLGKLGNKYNDPTIVSRMLDWYYKLEKNEIYDVPEKAYILEDFAYALGLFKHNLKEEIQKKTTNFLKKIIEDKSNDPIVIKTAECSLNKLLTVANN